MKVSLHNILCTDEQDIDFEETTTLHIPLTNITDALLISVTTFKCRAKSTVLTIPIVMLTFHFFWIKIFGMEKVFKFFYEGGNPLTL